MNGPVPTALLLASGPSRESLSWMFRYSKKSKRVGRGCSDLRTIVYLSGTSTVVHHLLCFSIWPLKLLPPWTRRRLYSTSALVNSRPEWYWTPFRRLNLICLESLLKSQLSASIGCGTNVSSYDV